MSLLKLNGTTVAYTEMGHGVPVVMVHGSASDGRTWQKQQPALARQFRTIVYSRRYHWPNEKIPHGADYSMAEHVEDLKALLRQFGAAPAHLIGHSYGGFVCLMLAMAAPGQVRSLVLEEPPVVPLFIEPPPSRRKMLRLTSKRPRAALALMKFAAAGVEPAARAARAGDITAGIQVFGRAVLGTEFYKRLDPARRAQVRANAIPAELLGSGLPPLPADQVRAVATPTLLLTGARSPRVFHHLADRLHELLPNSERVSIPAASHILHEDNPAAFREAAVPFLLRH